ncbi:MAG: TetR/AcrR family transcriptional regulator [Nocardioidaceae bacterium]|nr:TetR/AcrR family transcriptional regulator [Nocardioidaceae bacterium]
MARPREPWKRQRLLDVAMAEVSTKGVGAVTVTDVARAAGVSPGTVHYHFTDIDGVLLEVIERAVELMYSQRLAAISDVPGIPDKLLTLIELGIPDVVSHEITLLYEAVPRMRAHESFRPVLRSYVERQVSLYRSVIDAGIATGDFVAAEKPDTIARNLLALEDAYDLYLVLGLSDGASSRAAARSYVASALGLHLTED